MTLQVSSTQSLLNTYRGKLKILGVLVPGLNTLYKCHCLCGRLCRVHRMDIIMERVGSCGCDCPEIFSGEFMYPNGYLKWFDPSEPKGDELGRHWAHRLIMKKLLRRSLYWYEEVDHINGLRWDNREVNMRLWDIRNGDHWKRHLLVSPEVLATIMEELRIGRS